MPSVYILYSASSDRFYIGATTLEVTERLERHIDNFYGSKFTSFTKDWKLFFQISCGSMKQALKIESHIKKMKSKQYIKNLKIHPEIAAKLVEKYPEA